MRWIGIPRPVSRMAMACSLAALAAACGGDDGGGTGPGNDLAGNYQLVGADGDAVPAVVNSQVCGPSQILGGGLTIRADGRWEMRFDYQDEEGPDYVGDHGQYQRAGDDLLFTSEAWGDQFEGELDEGLVWIAYDFCNDNLGAELELVWSR